MTNNNLKFKNIDKNHKGTISLQITNQMINKYVELTGDKSVIHVDKVLAQKAGFRDRVMHGGLLIGLYSKIIGTILPGDSGLILELKSKFNNPIYPGDKITINYSVVETHISVSCITVKCKSTNQDGLVTGSALINVKVRL